MRSVFVLIAVCWIAAEANAQPTSNRDADVRRVLTVYTDDRLLPANQQIDDVLRVAIREGPFRISYFAEFLDAARFPSSTHNEITRAYFESKYRTQPPDVILVGGGTALEFFLQYRDTLFPATPILFMGLTNDEIPRERLDARVAGIPGAWEPRRAVELARRLQPDRTHVVVITGVAAREQGLLAPFRKSAEHDFPGVRFSWWERNSLAELETAVRTLPDDTLILFHMFYEGADGQFHLPRDAVQRLSAAASVPVYGPFESYVGYGIVGGTMETWEATGRAAAQAALRILAGEQPPAAARAVSMPLTTIVDWRQIERWRIDASRLPDGTVIRFRQPSIWQAYRAQVVIAAVIGLAQLALIGALAISLQRRRAAEATQRQAEARAAQLRVELVHAGRVSLLGELAGTLAHELNQPLAAILSNAQAVRRWLRSEKPDLREIRTAVDDVIADDKRAGEIIHRMRGLLKKEQPPRSRVDVGKAITDVANLIQGALIAADTTLKIDVPAGPLVVDAHEVEVQQVLLNLLTNGIQSVQESNPPARQVHAAARTENGRVIVSVDDSGRGIPSEVRDRLFEPFFTTKARGLGVGLNVCRRIAEAHGGSLLVGSSPIGGARFEFSLPLAAPP